MSRLAENRLSVEIGQNEFPLIVEDYDMPVFSRNGNLMMCISGFKNAVMNHGEVIRNIFVYDTGRSVEIRYQEVKNFIGILC